MIEEITSTTNKIVKETAKLQQKKYREESKLFLAEGEKAINGIAESKFEIEKLFVLENSVKDFSKINAKTTYCVNEAVLSKISSTKSACNCVAIAKQKKYVLNDFIKMQKLVLLENIKDAGNLGTILRSCKAFEIDGVLLIGDTIDLYNPKVVRASVGCFDIPVINIDYDDINKFSHKIYSTALHTNSVPLKNVDFSKPCILAFGAEADGLSGEFLKNKTQNIIIEMSDKVESLNLATAVSICFYKLFIG